MMARRFAGDPSITKQTITPGTIRRILPYAWRYHWKLAILTITSALGSVATVAVPLLLEVLIDNGILRHDVKVVATVAFLVGGLALLNSALTFVQGWYSARISQGVIYDLRTQVFVHVQRQPIAFFTRTQTGSLVSRLNTDVVLSQQAIGALLTSVVSNVLTCALVLASMFALSWLVTVIVLVLIPLFIVPARLVGRKLQRLTRESMQRTAEMGSTMNERFNVAGAILVKLYGRHDEEADLIASRAGGVRDIGVVTSMYGLALSILLTLLASLATALVYGLGGTLVVNGAFQVGSLVALAMLLNRLYGPISSLANLQTSVMTALVSFDRVFEVLDLKPLVAEQPGAIALPAPANATGKRAAPDVEFATVSFRYPKASEVSLASLESIAVPEAERESNAADALQEVSFIAPAGQLTALVGPSGAGKTTITHLVSRLYDPTSGAVRIGGCDLRDLTLDSLHETVGVVTQDAHLFHDTIRNNLDYARPGVSQTDMIEACRAAQIWNLISSLPHGLDTVTGDRGYRLSGGEKQRVALARLLLKAPPVVVLDEATAHLDSESEAAIQKALRIALEGRTSLVIAHRLSTIREASQILVVAAGRIVQRGTHERLLSMGGPYAELYHTQFAGQATARMGVEKSENHTAGLGPVSPPSIGSPAERNPWFSPPENRFRRAVRQSSTTPIVGDGDRDGQGNNTFHC
jgi:ATP-binding cassette subfamily B protein